MVVLLKDKSRKILLSFFCLLILLMLMSCKEEEVKPTMNTNESPIKSDTIPRVDTTVVPDTIAQKHSYRILALGDSYTIGESVSINERYPNQLAEALKKSGFEINEVKIIARTGWRTDDLDKAITSENIRDTFDYVLLLIGVNNQYQERTVDSYKPEFSNLLDRSISFAGGRKENVIVVSIPDYGYTPFGKSNQPSISRDIDSYNLANRTIATSAEVNYVNITDISREGFKDPALVAKDGLHPSGKMYVLWVERILPLIKK